MMMMAHASGPRAGHEAASLRFLALCLGGWVLLRLGMAWNPAMPVPPDAIRAPWGLPPVPVAPAGWDNSGAAVWQVVRAAPDRQAPSARPDPSIPRVLVANEGAEKWPARISSESGGFDADRHGLRLALIARLLPAATSALPKASSAWLATPPRGGGEPGQGKPFWIQRPLAKWSLGGWLYLQGGSAGAPEAIGAGGQLGGSQAGLRLAYGFGDSGRLRAYGRATMAVRAPEQRELAFGAAFAPVSRLPIDIAVEQRVAVGNEGRTALAVMATGGVSDVTLPIGFRLDAYAQAGVVGAHRRDGFADGAVVIDRRLGVDEQAPLRLGALAAGAIQPGASRVDVGPRLTVRLPDVGKGGRIALDWRQRVAGDARPESGLALTLATDF